MFSRWGSPRVGFALPIALFVCALMVLPAAAVLSAANAAHPGSGATSATGVSVQAPAASASTLHGEAAAPANLTTPNSDIKITRPNVSKTPSLVSSDLSAGKLDRAPDVNRNLGDLVSYPNSAILSSLSTPPAVQSITPGYVTTPAPLGLADYGVGGTGSGVYSYNTSSFLGTVNLASAPNVSAPTTQSVIDPSGSHLGLVGSPYEFSIQLNTVLTNVTIPGTNYGTFWTQNVIDVNATAIHFVDDVWNISANSGTFIPWTAPQTILSGCGLTNLTTTLEIGDGVYQCIGSTIAITAASYPLTIQLYNNASVTAAANDELQFGYRITGAGGLSATGVSDTLVFNNPNGTAVPPGNPVAFEVNGFSYAPIAPFLYDSELTFGGPIGGSNAVFRSIDGSIALQYAHKGGYKNIPAGYDFGADTGETAVGITGYWTAAGTEEINQGPSWLYGLWNGTASNSVASGDIQFKGTISPDYGFVFVTNNDAESNLSWVPTTVTGAFDSLLPPAVPTTGGDQEYIALNLAPGQTQTIGDAFSTSQTDYTFPTSTATDDIQAPIYMDGEAQAKSLAANVTGWTTGPYVFNGLTINLPLEFTRLNDYRYPEFVAFQAEGLKTTAVHVNNTTEGTNLGTGLYFTFDIGEPNWNFVPPAPYGPANNYTLQFNIWGSTSPKVTNETLLGLGAFNDPFNSGASSGGGGVFYFEDTDALAANITSAYDSFGVSNILSHDTSVRDLLGEYYGRALSDIGSTKTVGSSIVAFDGGVGVYELGSVDPSYTYLNASGDEAIGYSAGPLSWLPSYYVPFGAKDAVVKDLNATYDAIGAADSYSTDDTFSNVTTYVGAGVLVLFSTGATVEDVNANYGSGVGVEGSNYTNVSDATFRNECYLCLEGDAQAAVFGSNYTTFTSATFLDSGTYDQEGALVVGSNHTTFTDPVAQLGMSAYDAGITVYVSNYTTVTDALVRENYSLNASWTESEFYVEGIGGYGDNYTNLSGTTVQQSLRYGYQYYAEAELEDVYVSLIGLEFGDSNYTSIATTALTQTYWEGNISDLYDNQAYLEGIELGEVNATSVTGTTATQSSTTYDVDYDEYNDVTLVAIDGYDVNGTSVTTTVDHESVYRHDFYLYSRNYLELEGVSLEGSAGLTVTTSTFWVSNVTTDYDLEYDYELYFIGVGGSDMFRTTITDLTLYGTLFAGAYAISIDEAGYVNISKVTVTNSTVGVYLGYVSHANIVDLLASRYSIGVWTYDVFQVWVSDVSLTWASAGLLADEESYAVSISDVTATNATVQSPWAPYFYYYWGWPVSVVTAYDSDYVNVSNVAAVNYPGIIYANEVGCYYGECDEGQGVIASDITAIGGYALAYLNDTAYSLLTNLTGSKLQIGISLEDTDYNSYNDINITGTATYGFWMYDTWDSYFYALNLSTDWQGLTAAGDSGDNQIWGSTFYDDTSYAIYLFGSYDFEIWGNNFIDNNGATSTYNPAHIQAYAGYSPYYYFYNYTTDTGNYWSDWHSYTSSGVLAPYYVGDGNYDLYPLGAPADESSVVFYENGLAAGTTWSVTFDGTTQTTSGNALVFGAPTGTTAIDYTIGAVAGYAASPASGSVTPDVLTTDVAISFQATATVTLTESGLSSGTSWSATVGGITVTSTTTTMTFVLPVGNYTYDIVPVSGYSSSLTHGNVSLTNHGYSFLVAFSGSSSGTSYVPTKTFNPLFAIAIGLAAVAVVVALLALLRRPKAATPAPATPWQEPPAGPSTGSGGTGH